MNEEDIKKALASLYHFQLKALLYYENDKFTKVLINYTFDRFKEFSVQKKETYFYEDYLKNVNILIEGTTHNNYDTTVATDFLISRVEKFIIFVYKKCVDENFTQEKNGDYFDYRKDLGENFNKSIKDNKVMPEAFPKNKNGEPYTQNIVNLLKHVTGMRNTFAHSPTDGQTSRYKGYYYLQSFDVILAYILYAFYHMVLSSSKELKYLK